MQKWIRAQVNYVLFTDIAENSLEECERRYTQVQSRRRTGFFACDFVHMDATAELLSEKIDLTGRHANLVSCQFVLHYSFESFKQANTFLKNVSDALEVGGYFIGTTTDSYEIVKRLNRSDTNSFGNSIYRVTYLGDKNEPIPLFGAKFDFELEGVVNCPEYLVYFPLLVRLAEKYNLKLVARQTFDELFTEYSSVPVYRSLIAHMKSLELYNSNDLTSLKGDTDTDYSHMKEKNSNESQFFTLSKSEWEAATLYIAYSFVKVA
jgi:mRNA (guanine-N7-)-methyltransferase